MKCGICKEEMKLKEVVHGNKIYKGWQCDNCNGFHMIEEIKKCPCADE